MARIVDTFGILSAKAQVSYAVSCVGNACHRRKHSTNPATFSLYQRLSRRSVLLSATSTCYIFKSQTRMAGDPQGWQVLPRSDSWAQSQQCSPICRTLCYGGLKTGYKHLFLHNGHCTLVEKTVLSVLDVYVHEHHQRKGICKALFEVRVASTVCNKA